ncbi:MAG: HRDC domain-containing protein, partial [Atopobiaceae bacterium]|nr:HRDC domain-containing protein [Atopobiaceae bacterium]
AMTRKRVDDLADALGQEGFSIAAYHAGYHNDDRSAAQERFAKDDVQVMVATNAFGMGIDKSNVRFVINDGMPLSLEEYYQEAGRAGRDGEMAECHLLWSKGDIRTAHFLIDRTEFPPELSLAQRDELLQNRNRLLGAMIGYAMSTSCLRRRILSYFGQSLNDVGESCSTCSVCGWEEPRTHMTMAAYDPQEDERSSSTTKEGGQRLAHAHVAPELVTEEDEALFQRLRALRKSLADEAGMPPYIVFNDKTLREMVRLRPQNEEELLQVSGVGQTKLERYGAAFLEELAR